MSEELPPNPIPTPGTFNSEFFFNSSGGLNYKTAEQYFLKLSGGTVGYINTSTYLYNGSLVDFGSITGITSGTVSASKAVIVDSSKNITGFNNLTATNITGTLATAAQPNITSLGTLTGLNLNGSINLSASTTINNTLQWTSGTQPTTGNGIGIRFNGLVNSGTGYLRAYNYILNQDNNLDINNGNIYIKRDRNVGISQSSPQTIS